MFKHTCEDYFFEAEDDEFPISKENSCEQKTIVGFVARPGQTDYGL